MSAKPAAVFLDFATLGAAVDTARLDALLDLRYYDYSEPAEVESRICDAEVVIVNKTNVSRAAIISAQRLRLIALTGTGTDNVDIGAAAERSVAVANARAYCSTSVVQHVFALILSLTQQIGRYDALVRSGAWSASRSFALLDYPIRELKDRALGVVGYGTLGRAVGDTARCFGMQTLISERPRRTPLQAQKPRQTPPPALPQASGGRVPFDQVVVQADVVTLLWPLDASTHHLIGRAELGRMKRDALLINTARGALVDNQALADALKAGVIGGAGIDVLPIEPPDPADALLAPGIPNLIVTPHIAWAAREARQRALNQVAENVEHFLQGRSLRRVV
jgi:glycerate dehydrogenase